MKLCNVIPECPRTARDSFPPNWDWALLGTESLGENTTQAPKPDVEPTTEVETEETAPHEDKQDNSTNDQENENNPKESESNDDVIVVETNDEIVPNDVTSNDSGIEKEENETIENSINDDDAEELEESKSVLPQTPDDVSEIPASEMTPLADEETIEIAENVNGNDLEEIVSEQNNLGEEVEVVNNNADILELNTPENEPESVENEEQTDSGVAEKDEQTEELQQEIQVEEINTEPFREELDKLEIDEDAVPDNEGASEVDDMTREIIDVDKDNLNEEVEIVPQTPETVSPIKIIEISLEENDNNHQKGEEEEHDEAEEGVIEGVVNGENEIESVNEEGQGNNEDNSSDEEVEMLIEQGNMELLAGMVLNGEGDRLIGQTSSNSELQTFLDNVPIYMVSTISRSVIS